MIRSATIRGRHRLQLSRSWSDGPHATWLMLNPSRADGTRDDPTITRCINFARHWEFDGIHVVNLFTRITPSPAELLNSRRLNHPDADHALHTALAGAGVVICAWGAHARHPKVARRVKQVVAIAAKSHASLHHLGLTKHSHPRHPLYLPAHLEPIPWNPRPQIRSSKCTPGKTQHAQRH